jgi:hypothetical protein
MKMRGSERNKEERFNMIRRKLEQGIKEEIKALIDRDYSMISGEKVREMFASDVLRLIKQRHDYATRNTEDCTRQTYSFITGRHRFAVIRIFHEGGKRGEDGKDFQGRIRARRRSKQ